MKYQDDPTVPRGVSHPTDVPMVVRVAQCVLRVGDPDIQCASSGEHAVTDTDLSAVCQMESSIKLSCNSYRILCQGHSFLAKIN